LPIPVPTDRIDPERTLDVGTDLVGKGAVEQVEERLGLRRRKVAGRQHSYRQAKPGEANVDKPGDVVLSGTSLVEVNDSCHLPRHALRQATPNKVPMALH
jgi:hypothetical protein